MRPCLATTFIALAAFGMLARSPVYAAPEDQIRGPFSRFVHAQNAHDLKEVGNLLSDSPDFLWISPGHVVRNRVAALDRFRELFKSAWRIDPDWSTFQVLWLDVSTVEIGARVSISGGGPARMGRMNLILANSAHGWRVLNILVSDLPPT